MSFPKSVSRVMAFSSFLLLLVLPGTSFSADTMGWNLVWSDEFDKNGLPDGSKWGYDVGDNGWGLQEIQYYTSNRSENARVENGNLIIEARRENFSGRQYTSTRLVSRGKCEKKYGRFETRLIVPGFRGIFPAFWMIPSDQGGGWPAFGELDVMEHFGFDPGIIRQTMHCAAHAVPQPVQISDTLPDCSTNYHVYRMDWYKDSIVFYIDDKKTLSYKETQDYAHWPYTKPFYMILQIPVGGSFAGQKGIDDSQFPTKMVVDYVRYYEWGVVPVQQNLKPESSFNNRAVRITTDGQYINVNASGRFTASLVDVAGRVVARQSGSVNQCRFNKKGLGSGMFFVCLDEARNALVQQVMIQ
jgi:beta-glucanase (GH16 family)